MRTAAWRQSGPRWLLGLAPIVAVLFGASLAVFAILDRPIVATDAALYQHVGWLATRRGVPYVDIWEINPPLTFALTAGLAFLSGGDMLLLHASSATVTLLATVASVLLVGWLAARVTDEDAAGLVAGLVLLAVPELYGHPPYGVRSQYFALLSVVAALALASRDRPLLAGASVAASAGFWQPGIASVPIVLGMTLQRSGRRGLRRATFGGLALATLTVFPFVAAGAFVPMVVETVIAPLYGQAQYTLLGRGYAIVNALGYATALLPFAGYGWLLALTSRDRWWVPAGGLIYAGVAMFLNMNGSLDLLLWLVFVALGVAIAVESVAARPSYRVGLVALVGLTVLVAPAWHLPTAPLKEQVETRQEKIGAKKVTPIRDHHLSVPGMRTIYWQKLRPETCHYRLSWTERRWIVRTGARLGDEICGEWSDWRRRRSGGGVDLDASGTRRSLARARAARGATRRAPAPPASAR